MMEPGAPRTHVVVIVVIVVLALVSLLCFAFLKLSTAPTQADGNQKVSVNEQLVDWREIVSGPHFAEGTTFFITKGRDGRHGYVVFCSKEQSHVYLGMRKPVMVSIRLVQPEGVPISNFFLVAVEFKELKADKKPE